MTEYTASEFQPLIQPTDTQPFWGMSTTPDGVQIEAIGESAAALEKALREGERDARMINAILNPDSPAKTVNRSIRVPSTRKMPWRIDDGIDHPVTLRVVGSEREKATCWREYCTHEAEFNVARQPSGALWGYCSQHRGDIFPYDGSGEIEWDGSPVA